MSGLLVHCQVMKRFFLFSVLAVTITPYLLMVSIFNGVGGYAILILGLLTKVLSSAHVPMTLYLLIDKDIRSKCRNDLTNSIIIPLGFLIASTYAFIIAPLYITMIFIVFFLHYQIWHFGSQNIGFYSLSTISTQSRPISLSERRTIKLSTIGGMMGTLATFQSYNLSLDPIVFPFDLVELFAVSKILYNIGAMLTICSISYAIYLIIKIKLYTNPFNFIIYIASVLFFVPIFLSNNFLLTFLTYGIAHGLQYILILFFHSLSNVQNLKVNVSRLTILRCLFPILLFLIICISITIIWSYRRFYGSGIEDLISLFISYIKSGESSLRIAMGIVYGLILSHFWFDQNLWKFRNPQTANWMKSRYPFVFASSVPS